jgi:hypothetical protein
MKHPDPFEKLLQNWTPQNPHDISRYTRETMSLIRGSPKESLWERISVITEDFLNTWLPSPNVLLPIALGMVLFFAATASESSVEKVKNIAAIQWYDEITNPLAQNSLTGVFKQQTRPRINE